MRRVSCVKECMESVSVISVMRLGSESVSVISVMRLDLRASVAVSSDVCQSTLVSSSAGTVCRTL